MNRLLFEGRSLVEIVASIIRQDDGHVPFNRLDWERMYRLADYHKVANTVYLGLLVTEKRCLIDGGTVSFSAIRNL